MTGLKEEIERVDIKLLIQYGVDEAEYGAALAVFEKFKENCIAVTLLRTYYSDLPEGCEEMAVDLKVVAKKQGTFLMNLQSTNHHYLYLCSEEEAVFLGEFKDGIDDETILNHFGFASIKDFWQQTDKNPEYLPSLSPPTQDKELTTCVACGVEVGEPHIFGCPVEQCPWCEAHLSRCNCRFDQLGVSDITDEELLDDFEEMLELKGRIVFEAGQNPSYPTAGDDPGPATTPNDQ